jgi:hypothetical protein
MRFVRESQYLSQPFVNGRESRSSTMSSSPRSNERIGTASGLAWRSAARARRSSDDMREAYDAATGFGSPDDSEWTVATAGEPIRRCGLRPGRRFHGHSHVAPLPTPQSGRTRPSRPRRSSRDRGNRQRRRLLRSSMLNTSPGQSARAIRGCIVPDSDARRSTNAVCSARRSRGVLPA